jgi:hypothetical protein
MLKMLVRIPSRCKVLRENKAKQLYVGSDSKCIVCELKERTEGIGQKNIYLIFLRLTFSPAI